MAIDMTKNNYNTLLITKPAQHVLLVTLNRPDVANAFNTQMARDIIDLFEGLAMDAGDIRAVVVTGAGDGAFCAGGDLEGTQRYELIRPGACSMSCSSAWCGR